MKTLVTMILMLVSANAFARWNTAELSAAQAQQIVNQAGRIVMTTGAPGLYDLFYSANTPCDNSSDRKITAKAMTKDGIAAIGYACVDRDMFGGGTRVSPYFFHTCKEGSFGSARKKDYYPGSVGVDSGRESIQVVCQAGKWVPSNDRSWVTPVTKGGLQCREGAMSYYPYGPEHNHGEIAPGTIIKKCIGGKWIRQN